MKAMIFAAGLGTRLRPLTNDRPKALVKVGGVVMLERVINRLKGHGIDEIVINIHHFGEKIIDFLKENNNFGINIHISDERDLLLDTGGGILKTKEWLDGNEPIIIHNADILTDFDLHKMVKQHIENDADATLLVADRKTARYFYIDDTNRLRGWTNISTGEVKPANYIANDTDKLRAFGGVHIVSPAIFNELKSYSNEPKFSITPFYIDKCNDLKIMGYTPTEDYKWHDIGKIESIAIAEKEFCDNININT
ncbi:MAG: nucleotidyltransferase family protein [Bacteroidales bacterium]|nr:nucleotidyltransferase family protein [Bacteroidales bacterium]